MKLKLSEWASVAEIVSGIAVVVTLIVLVFEIRDNTQVLRASAYAASLDGINDFGAMISKDAESARIWRAYVTETTGDLDEIDLSRLNDWVYILFRNYEKAYFSEQAGLIGDEEWARFDRNICGMFELARSAGLNIDTPLTSEFFQYVTSSCSG